MRIRNLSLLILFVSQASFAFPDMIRHGYTSCTSCHVSPGGGGLLTAYGRTISSELLSRWSFAGEEQPLQGMLKGFDGSEERGFNIGGDLRFLQTRTETKEYKRGRFVPMQRDVEAAFKYDNFSVVASYGLIYDPFGPDKSSFRRYYGLWNISDRISVRAGKFTPVFGIMLSDHYLSIKQGQQLGLGSERNTIESHLIFEKWSAHMSLSKSTEVAGLFVQEHSATGGLNYNVTETARLGVNYWLGSYKGGRRDITGINALIGFNKFIYSLSEVDLQVDVPNDLGTTKGIRYFQRLGYEISRGLHLFTQIDGSQTDLKKTNTRYNAPGVGASFFPRPHFDLQLTWTRPKYEDQARSDSAFFVFHYYL